MPPTLFAEARGASEPFWGFGGYPLADNLALAFTDANYASVLQKGLIRQRRMPRQPGATNLRIVVRDVGSGSLGSLTIPFSRIEAPPQKPTPE